MLISRGLSIRYEWEKIGRLAGIYRKLNVHYSTALLARVNQFTSKAFIFFYQTFNQSLQCKLGFFHHRGYLFILSHCGFTDQIKRMHGVRPHAVRESYSSQMDEIDGRGSKRGLNRKCCCPAWESSLQSTILLHILGESKINHRGIVSICRDTCGQVDLKCAHPKRP